jgi:hypothetical protein
LFIVSNHGAFTYIGQNGYSVIDYLVVRQDTIDAITAFEIGTRSEFSHMPIIFSIKIKKYIEIMRW